MGNRGGQRCRGQSSLQPQPCWDPQAGQAQPQGPPASDTWGQAGTGSAITWAPRSAPIPRAGLQPCRGDAAPAPAAVPPALRLRCHPGARLLFLQTAPALVAHDFFMPGWRCPRRGVPRPPEPRHPSRDRPAAVTDPRNGAGSAFGPRRGGNKWVRVLGDSGGGPWVAGGPRGSRWVPAGTCPAAQSGAAFIHPGPPPRTPGGSGSPRGGSGRCPTGTACPCVPLAWGQPDPSALRGAETLMLVTAPLTMASQGAGVGDRHPDFHPTPFPGGKMRVLGCGGYPSPPHWWGAGRGEGGIPLCPTWPGGQEGSWDGGRGQEGVGGWVCWVVGAPPGFHPGRDMGLLRHPGPPGPGRALAEGWGGLNRAPAAWGCQGRVSGGPLGDQEGDRGAGTALLHRPITPPLRAGSGN